MFLELQDGLLNVYYLNTLFVEYNEETAKYNVVYELVNGTKRYEEFDTQEEANTRYINVKEQIMG